MNDNFKNFDDFWRFYVKQHRLAHTRLIHFLGTAIAGTMFLLAFVFGSFKLFLFSFVAGYGPAWVSHFMIEKNQPATFTHPLFSFLADLKMFYLMVIGKMDEEAEIILRTES